MLITEFLQTLEATVPLASAGYEKDAVGLQVGLDQTTKLRNALFCYEVTQDVVAEAKERDANLIVAFHPLIFPNISSITERDRTGSLVRELIRSEIALYVQHTAFDAQTEFGTSRLMAEVLELDNIRPLAPLRRSTNKITVFVPYASSKAVMEALIGCGAGKIGGLEGSSFQFEGRRQFRSVEVEQKEGEPTVLEGVDEVRLEMVCDRWKTPGAVRALAKFHEKGRLIYDITPLESENPAYGMGAVGEWEEGRTAEAFLTFVAEAFGSQVIRHNRAVPEAIRRVAVLGGAGMEYYAAARSHHADAFVTADVRYHDFYRADHDRILLADAGHAETERFVTRGMVRAASEALDRQTLTPIVPSEMLLVSRSEPNSVRYFCRDHRI